MPSNEFQPKLLRMRYFKAPPVSAVTPYVIPKRTEVIELVTEGVIHFQAGGRRMELGCGALFWHVAGEETIHRTEPDAPYRCLAIALSAAARVERSAPRVSVITDQQKARELCWELLNSYHDDSVDRQILGRYAHARLLWEAHLASQPTTTLRPPAVDAALVYIEEAFSRHDIGVSHLARAAGISEPHIHALFRQYLGVTPHQALTARRIREAKWLLSGTNQTIKAIVTNCGFLNIETFYRAFKKIVGATPHEFRSRHGRPILENL